jgi:hypothetical protein
MEIEIKRNVCCLRNFQLLHYAVRLLISLQIQWKQCYRLRQHLNHFISERYNLIQVQCFEIQRFCLICLSLQNSLLVITIHAENGGEKLIERYPFLAKSLGASSAQSPLFEGFKTLIYLLFSRTRHFQKGSNELFGLLIFEIKLFYHFFGFY